MIRDCLMGTRMALREKFHYFASLEPLRPDGRNFTIRVIASSIYVLCQPLPASGATAVGIL